MGSDESTKSQSPTETPDERFAESFRKRREMLGLSQSEVAEKMTERGFACHQQTIAKVERGARSVRIGEAQALAAIVETSVDYLMMPTDAAIYDRLLITERSKSKRLYEALVENTSDLLKLQMELHSAIEKAKEVGGERIEKSIRLATERLAFTPDRALVQAVQDLAEDAMRKRDDLDVVMEQGGEVADLLYQRQKSDRPVGVRVDNMLALLIRRYRRLWWDPRSLLRQYLILILELHDAGISVPAIARRIGEEVETVEQMIEDGKDVRERGQWMALDTRFSSGQE